METNNPLSELTDMLKATADVLQSAVSSVPEEHKKAFNDELIKQGYDKKMGELRNKMAELNDMQKKF